MRSVRSRLHLIWADKIALWLAFLAVAALVICWLLVATAAGVEGANHVALSFGLDSTLPVAAILLTLWALMRAIDFIAGGATYRLFVPRRGPEIPAVIVHEAPPSSGKPMAAI
jgi:hypothetical protein